MPTQLVLPYVYYLADFTHLYSSYNNALEVSWVSIALSDSLDWLFCERLPPSYMPH